MSDVADVRKALIAKLETDSTLAGLVPDDAVESPTKAAVYFNVSPAGVTKAVIVSLVIGEDVYALRSTAYQRLLFLVKAVERSTDPAGVDAAAARIQELLHAQPLTIDGYKHMVTLRDEPISYAEVDDDDVEEHWQHSGGRYEIFATPDN